MLHRKSRVTLDHLHITNPLIITTFIKTQKGSQEHNDDSYTMFGVNALSITRLIKTHEGS